MMMRMMKIRMVTTMMTTMMRRTTMVMQKVSSRHDLARTTPFLKPNSELADTCELQRSHTPNLPGLCIVSFSTWIR